MRNESTSAADATESGAAYYYSGGKQVPLVTDPTVVALKLETGRSALSGQALALLRERAEPLMTLPHYGIRVIDARTRSRRDEMIESLSTEPAIDFVTPAYRHAPENPDLMFVSDRFVAQFKKDVGKEAQARLHAQYGVEVVGPLDYAPNGYLLACPRDRSVVSVANAYYESGLTLFAHPDFIRRHSKRAAAMTAERPATQSRAAAAAETAAPRRAARAGDFLPEQWHLDIVRAAEAWQLTRGSAGITVAVLDDGVDLDHAEFQGKITGQYDFAGDVPDGNPKSDGDKHGTACAGVAVASGEKAFGTAPGCSLLAIRTPDYLGVADEARMFLWAADNGADVISCSWGPADGLGSSDPLPDNVAAAIHECVRAGGRGRGGKGIPICWAAGNGNESVSLDGYASCPDVMAIAASTSKDEARAYYSDFGPEVCVCAPSSGRGSLGEKRIFTTDRRGAAGYNTGDSALGDTAGDYTNDFGGTSSATPLVAGICGLILSANPDLTPPQVRDILQSTAEKIGGAGAYDTRGHSNDLGYGRVDARRAVEEAQRRRTGGGGSSDPVTTEGIHIEGPETWPRGGGAPTFTCGVGPGQFWAVEVATRAELFNRQANGGQRTDDNFHATWKALPFRSQSSYRLPDDVWERMKTADSLFYRLWKSDSATQWQNHEATVTDADFADAPSITLTEDGEEPEPAPAEPSTVRFPSGAEFTPEEETTIGGIDYTDPVTDGSVPLLAVKGREQELLSANFKVKELACRDNAPYARIAVEMVELLQSIRDQVGALTVRDAYRHPAYNKKVSGKPDSRHLSGQSVLIQSATKKPLDLAKVALEVSGGAIGLGLGGSTLRIDVRGETATWVESGAAMSAAAFETWVDDTVRNLGDRSTRSSRGIGEETGGKAGRSMAGAAAKADDGSPRIIGPESYDPAGESPAFMIKPGAGRYLAVEVVADDPTLFRRGQNADRRTDSTAYASWGEGLMAAGGNTTYQLPARAWERLRSAERLYYRVLSTSADDGSWAEFRTSTPDSLAETAPSIALRHERTARRGAARTDGLPQGRRPRDDEELWRNG